MDYRIEVDPATGWGVVTVSGKVGLAELCELFNAAWSDPGYRAVERARWNFLGATTDMQVEDLARLAAWIGDNKGGRGPRLAAMVAADDVMFGMGRAFDALFDGYAGVVKVFRTEAQADAWLREA